MSMIDHAFTGAAERLAEDGVCSVFRCPCGCLHVNVGPTTLRLSPETLRELAQVLTEADRRSNETLSRH